VDEIVRLSKFDSGVFLSPAHCLFDRYSVVQMYKLQTPSPAIGQRFCPCAGDTNYLFRNQIRFCYESQLTRFPKLNGKVAVRFVITAAGTVSSSQVAQSTVNNGELETCIAGRVQTWIFPKPKGGGVVIVTYPFILKQSGE